MTPAEFRAALEALGLRQIDFARLLCTLAGQPADPKSVTMRAGTVNRWAQGEREVPDPVAAFLAAWGLISQTKRRQVLNAAGISPGPQSH